MFRHPGRGTFVDVPDPDLLAAEFANHGAGLSVRREDAGGTITPRGTHPSRSSNLSLGKDCKFLHLRVPIMARESDQLVSEWRAAKASFERIRSGRWGSD